MLVSPFVFKSRRGCSSTRRHATTKSWIQTQSGVNSSLRLVFYDCFTRCVSQGSADRLLLLEPISVASVLSNLLPLSLLFHPTLFCYRNT